MKRLFVGITAPEEIRSRASAWASDKRDWPVRWVGPDNLHLTVIPPFYSGQADLLAELLDDAAGAFKPFRLKFDRISYGPRPERPSLIWAAGNECADLNDLNKMLVAEMDLPAADRILLPHLTLARFKPRDVGRLTGMAPHVEIDWIMTVRSIKLLEVRSGPAGSEYSILKSSSLKNTTTAEAVAA